MFHGRLRTLGGELAWFAGGDGSHDWDYPFDLCGTVYRKAHVEQILRDVEATDGLDGLSHPNKLEAAGNRAIARLCSTKSLAQHTERGCLQRRAMVVVTINRVQSVFSNRVFRPAAATTAAAAAAVAAAVATHSTHCTHTAHTTCTTPAEEAARVDGKIASDKGGGASGEWHVDALDRLLYSGQELDEDAYLAHRCTCICL